MTDTGMICEFDVDMEMRDGVVLRANVFRPDKKGTYPGILLRTPYCKPIKGYDRYIRSGYAVVAQDSRGRYASDGDWIPFTVDYTGDAEDGYDSVEWLATQQWCNGRVGTMGASYEAWMQWKLAKLRPPHLVAMCAYTIPLDLRVLDWPGGFRPGRRVKWWLTQIAPDLRRRHGLEPPHTKEQALSSWDEANGDHPLMRCLPWLDFPRHLPPGLATYIENWLRSPNRRIWKFDEVHHQVDVPNLDFSGWYDHCNDSMHHLQLMQRHARTETARSQTKLIAGPWNHPGLGKHTIAGFDFGTAAQIDLPETIIRWFDYWLKDIDNGVGRDPAVRYFVMHGCGNGQWRSSSTWPPPDIISREYCLSGKISSHLLQDSELLLLQTTSENSVEAAHFDYDPQDPVPTLWANDWFTGPSDRRELEDRSDILRYVSPPLTEPVEIAGYPEAVLHVSSTAPDTDFFARLVDEHPETVNSNGVTVPGIALEICYGMVRARHRKSLDFEEMLTPGEVTQMHISLGPTACRFELGHRIRLEITSSDFPNHDRNHNTGGNDLADVHLIVATNTVHHSAEHKSRLLLPVCSDPEHL